MDLAGGVFIARPSAECHSALNVSDTPQLETLL
jgi:hypothetical protein